ncbi:anthrone oxygenase family protein [Nakamurella lactea]|uniref:anthrone oxygenase family protein n=1 Tax=Nakamurella lactea TaxID=459515 RepID=UPI0003F52979|nr:anthrone oxygenase family protein [Nakamurella lactea]
MTDQLLTVLTVVAATGSGLVAGVMLAFSTLVMGGLRQLPSADGIRAMQRINSAAPRPMFMLAFVGTGLVCLFLLVQAVTALDRPGSGWRLIGSAAYLATVLITGGFHLPRNAALDRVDPDDPGSAPRWHRYLAQWLPANHLRLLTAAAGCVLLMLSLLPA